MVRALVFVSAILAMVAFVSAAPFGGLVDAFIHHIGTSDVNLQKSGNKVVDAENLNVHDVGQNIDVA